MITMKSSSIILKNNSLAVTMSMPGAFYSGSRFDWNGFITDIKFNDKYSYCVPESLNNDPGSTGGCGLCGEFGIDEPIGFSEIKKGGYFPKIGVGLLQKPDEKDYFFARPYALKPYKTEISTVGDCVAFKSMPIKCGGYAFLYQKSVSVSQNDLVIDYTLRNVGEKAVCTTEYCHNFIGINNILTGHGYTLTLPHDFNINGQAYGITRAGNCIMFENPGDKNIRFEIADDKGIGFKSWTLFNNECGAGVTENDDFTACNFVVWAAGHVISAETFKKIELNAGESQSWQRKYSFFEKQ